MSLGQNAQENVKGEPQQVKIGRYCRQRRHAPEHQQRDASTETGICLADQLENCPPGCATGDDFLEIHFLVEVVLFFKKAALQYSNTPPPMKKGWNFMLAIVLFELQNKLYQVVLS